MTGTPVETTTRFRLPVPRGAAHDRLPLSALVAESPAPDDAPERPVAGAPDFAARLLLVAQVVAVGALVLVAATAVLSARYSSDTFPIHPLGLAAWGLAAAVGAVALASLRIQPAHRSRAVGPLLFLGTIASVTGVVTSADGVAGPAWVLFLPIVLVTGAVLGAVPGLLAGTAAAAGIYVAAGLSHTLTVAGVGRLVVLLPACPAIGWAAGALAGLAAQAAAEAASRRTSLEADVRRLSGLLEEVADGDLSKIPAVSSTAEPAVTDLAVVFADTLLALRRLVRRMDLAVDSLATSSGAIAGAAGRDVEAVDTQVTAVSETTSTIEQLAATAGSIADIAVRVTTFAGSTRLDVDTGATSVAAVSSAMHAISSRVADLTARADQLRDLVGGVGTTTAIIEQLSRRTSILAVNASIEAARAGEHGHGFAHVATEVSVLADRARAAAASIAAIVTDLDQTAAATAAAGREGMAAVAAGTQRQADVVTALERISAMVDETTIAAREITSATRMQRVASHDVVDAMVTVTHTGDRHRAVSRSHAEAANRLRELAADLQVALGRFSV